jgi:hypothetical protein
MKSPLRSVMCARLTIRPFATTSKYDSPTLDLQEAGKPMHVTDVVTGHFLKEGSQLQITLEAIDVENNRTLWRDTMTVAAPDMIAMRGADHGEGSPGTGSGSGCRSATPLKGATHPKNEEAYDLYLRSLSLPHDPLPNKDAIAMLERAVGLDPPTRPPGTPGHSLPLRFRLFERGAAALERADAAFEKALALDPNYISPAAELMLMQTERGDVVKAYQRGKALLAQHPESAMLHFALAYALRYGGALEESGHECDTALALDPGNYGWRSCAFTFNQLGNYPRALIFLQLDAGSKWSDGGLLRQDIREGKLTEALELARRAEIQPMIACLEDPSSAKTATLTRESAAQVMANPDSEPEYVRAADILFCGQKELALKMVKNSIDRHFCPYAGLQNDSAWAKVRGTPEFAELVSAAKQCRDEFMAKRTQGQ